MSYDHLHLRAIDCTKRPEAPWRVVAAAPQAHKYGLQPKWWRNRDSSAEGGYGWARVASIHRPADYESAALTRLSYGPCRLSL